MTYSELKTAVSEYFHRSDLASKMDEFIARAEASIFREISPASLETNAAGTTSGATIAIPADMDVLRRVEIESAGIKHSIGYISPSAADVMSAGSDFPKFYTVENGMIRLVPEPSTAYPYVVYYVAKLLPLSATNTTNWLLSNAQDLYFYAVMVEAARYLKNDAELNRASQLVLMLIDTVRNKANRERFGQSGGLRIRVRSVA